MNVLPGQEPIVVKIGGAALDDPAVSAPVLRGLAELHRSRPGGVVLIHGGGGAVDRQLARLGLASEKRHGVRITPPEHLEQVVAVLAGQVNAALVGGLLACSVPAVGLILGAGGLTTAATLRPDGFDAGRVGAITGGDPTVLATLLRAGYLPVVSSIAIDSEGAPLNINADDAAVALAVLVRARALLLLTDVPGVLDAQRRIIPEIDGPGVERLIAGGVITGGMIPKIRAAALAADSTGIPAVIASWHDMSHVPALARGVAVGTRIVPRRT